MTRDEILQMEAGREIDALVAELVMGWTKVRKASTWESAAMIYSGTFVYTIGVTPDQKTNDVIPYHSTDIAAAWQVVEKMRLVGVSMWIGPHLDNEWAVQIKPSINNYHEFVRADTAPLAICRAALLAVMESTP